ncbi:hypothetical protein [Metamycoplasma equirhinis]|uniref:hypothetical protein n=1 Tax=Metamycoplasma equirhinis TaxID=92402 RepID=UPI003593EF0B
MNKNLEENIENAKIILFKGKDIKKNIAWLVVWNFISAILCTLLVTGIYFLRGAYIQKYTRVFVLTTILLIVNLYLPIKITLLKKLVIYKDINNYKFVKYLMAYFIISFCFAYYKEIKTDYINSRLIEAEKEKFKKIAKYFNYYNTVKYTAILSYLNMNNLEISKYNIAKCLLNQYEENNDYEPLNILLCLNSFNKKKLLAIITNQDLHLNFKLVDDSHAYSIRKINNLSNNSKTEKMQKMTLAFNMISIVILSLYFLSTIVFIFGFTTNLSISLNSFKIGGAIFSELTLLYIFIQLTWILPVIINLIAFVMATLTQKLSKRDKVAYILTFLLLTVFSIAIAILNEFAFVLHKINQTVMIILGLILIFITWIPFAFYLKVLIKINIEWYQKYYSFK